MEESTLVPEPENILERSLKKKGNHAGVECLVQWKVSNVEDATWMDEGGPTQNSWTSSSEVRSFVTCQR